MEHIIYKITNQLNGRFYIGMHSTKDINDGYLGSGRRIKAEVKKYGRQNFKKEILEVVSSRKILAEREAEIVNEELLQDPLCLNLKNGGEGSFDYINSTGKNLYGKNGENGKKNLLYGHERIERIKKNGNYDAYIQNMSSAIKKNIEDNGHWWEGRTHSTESKAKMKSTRAERQCGVGEKNSRYGVKNACINKDGKNKRIPIDQLNQFIADGWSKGMVKKTIVV